MSSPKFSYDKISFHAELKKRINDYFKEVGKSSTGNYKLFIKAIALIISFVFIYIHLVFFTPPVWLALIECIILGGINSSHRI